MSLARADQRVLILGGTSEARELASALDQAGVAVVSSLAGRLEAPRLPTGDVRFGGFGGPEGLAAWLVENGVAAVVDATHPVCRAHLGDGGGGLYERQASRCSGWSGPAGASRLATAGTAWATCTKPPTWYRGSGGASGSRSGARVLAPSPDVTVVLVPDPLHRGARAAAAGSVPGHAGSRPVHDRG